MIGSEKGVFLWLIASAIFMHVYIGLNISDPRGFGIGLLIRYTCKYGMRKGTPKWW